MLDRRRFLTVLAAGLTPLAGTQAAMLDQTRILVGFPPGGTVDATARRIADKLRDHYAKTALVDNRPGAGGRLAVEELKRSANDGSYLLLTPAAMITLYPHVYVKLPYGINDVTPVCGATSVAFAWGVGPAVPDSVRSIQDFLAWAKQNPKQAVCGSPGAGSPPHFLAALLSKESGVELNHVPYKGSAPGLQDLLGGQIAAFSSPVGDYLQHVKAGHLRVLATSGPRRSRFLPDVPTYTEQGFKPLEQIEWYGFFLPGKAPIEVVERAGESIRIALQAPEITQGLATLGLDTMYTSPAELSSAVIEEHKMWAPIVKRVGFTVE